MTILEYVGRVNGGFTATSVAHLTAPVGWSEPFQKPTFDEITVVVQGTIRIEYPDGFCDVEAGQAAIVQKDVRIQ